MVCSGIEVMHEDVPAAPPCAFDEFLDVAYPPERCERERAMVDELTKSRAFEGVDSGRYLDGTVTLAMCEAIPIGRVLGRVHHPDSCNCPPCYDRKRLLVAQNARGEWMTEQQFAMQRAALTGDITQGAGGTSYPTSPKRLEPPVGAD
jgi:hypothetical protein